MLAALFFTLVVNRLAPPTARGVRRRRCAATPGCRRPGSSTTLVVVLSLAVYGTVALAIDQPGGGISTDVGVAADAGVHGSTARGPGHRPAVVVHVPLSDATAGSRQRSWCCRSNQKIQFHVTSLDVIHSFWFYALGVKADAVPLNDNVVTATPTQIGTYRVQCAELCGLWHGNMADNTAMVVSPSDFATWIQQQTTLDAPIMKYPAAVQPHVSNRSRRSTGTDRVRSASTREEADVDAVAPARPPMSTRRRHWHGVSTSGGCCWASSARSIGFVVGCGIGSVAIANSFEHGQLARLRPRDPARLRAERGRLPCRHGLPQLPDRPPARRPAALRGGQRLPARRRRRPVRYFRMTTDHKVIGMQYLVMILAFLFIGGLGAMFIRSELLTPTPSVANAAVIPHAGRPAQHADDLHGVDGDHRSVRQLLRADHDRRRATWRSRASRRSRSGCCRRPGLILLSTVFLGGFTDRMDGLRAALRSERCSAWTPTSWASRLIGLSIALSGLNMIATILTKRAPGMPLTRMPIFVWSVLVTSFLGLARGTSAHRRGPHGDRSTARTRRRSSSPRAAARRILWENLFWFFGHPEVYIFIVPAFGLIMEMLPVLRAQAALGLSRRSRRHGRRRPAELRGLAAPPVRQRDRTVAATLLHVLDGDDLGADRHHLPGGAGNDCGERALASPTPMLFIFAFFFNFLIGGFTGVFLSDVPERLHAPCQLLRAGALPLHDHGRGGLRAHGRDRLLPAEDDGPHHGHQAPASYQFWAVFLTFNGTFISLIAVGILGMPRRVISYAAYLQPLNDLARRSSPSGWAHRWRSSSAS